MLGLFFETALDGTRIIFSGFAIELIPACIAGSAYYLLFVLNMIIPNINIKKRISMIAFAFASLFVLNVLRIFILSIMASYNLLFFSIAHKFFWYFLNIVMVVLIWFAEVFFFKLKGIPFYTDVYTIYSAIKHKK
jgi:exosortase/archaeosortase family protein